MGCCKHFGAPQTDRYQCFREAFCCFELGLRRGACIHNWSPPWLGLEPRFSLSRAQRSTTESSFRIPVGSYRCRGRKLRICIPFIFQWDFQCCQWHHTNTGSCNHGVCGLLHSQTLHCGFQTTKPSARAFGTVICDVSKAAWYDCARPCSLGPHLVYTAMRWKFAHLKPVHVSFIQRRSIDHVSNCYTINLFG